MYHKDKKGDKFAMKMSSYNTTTTNGSTSGTLFQRYQSQSQRNGKHSDYRLEENICANLAANSPSSSNPVKDLSQNSAELSDTEEDSPLDFSQKKTKVTERESSETDNEPESPCSRLRDILSMKSPTLPEDFAASVLNLSKESPISAWLKAESRGSESISPIVDSHQAFANPLSPRGATAALTAMTPISSISNNNCNGLPHMTFSPYGAFSPTISPALNQNLPINGSGISLANFEADAISLFSPHLAGVVGSGNMGSLPYSSDLPLQILNNGSAGPTKGRATRPFKAYPKDPLRFPSVGMYGLPIGLTAPTGTAEAMIHQQSHQAYTEFRKRMLAQSQTTSKSRRAAQRGMENSLCPSLSLNCRSTMDIGTGSSAEENEVAEEEGKNLSGKTEQQMKDEAYWERRRKNNEAAKRSRDARRAKEDEIAIRAAFLEQENGKLRYELSLLRSETNRLRRELYNGSS